MSPPEPDTSPAYRPWMNAVLYQGIWFVAVLGREDWQLAGFALLALHVAVCRERPRELGLMVAIAAVGLAVDSALALGGVFAFDPSPAPLPVPSWLAAIWLGFAATFRHALAFAVARAPLAVAAGAVGGPLSYLAAARLGAVTLPLGAWTTGLLLAPIWAALMFAFVHLARAIERRVVACAPSTT